jgi:hypothetical protein
MCLVTRWDRPANTQCPCASAAACTHIPGAGQTPAAAILQLSVTALYLRASAPTAPDTFYNYTTTDNVTFHYFPAQRPAAEAQAACHPLTAHLASYTSLAQQAEVEQHYVSAGLLLPTFSPVYWLGLAAQNASQWPLFTWAEPGLAAPTRQRDRCACWPGACWWRGPPLLPWCAGTCSCWDELAGRLARRSVGCGGRAALRTSSS